MRSSTFLLVCGAATGSNTTHLNGYYCGRNPIEVGWATSTSITCGGPECSPPRYFVIADANGKANIITFKTLGDAENPAIQGSYNWWKDYVTRCLWDVQAGTCVQKECSCDGCNDQFTYFKQEARSIAECKYPSGQWQLVFAELTPQGSYTRTEKVTYGVSRTSTTDNTESISISTGVEEEGFKASMEFKAVVENTDSRTWSASREVDQSWQVSKGNSIAVYQFHMQCIGFTSWGLFTETVVVGTSIFKETSGSKPKCIPFSNDKPCDPQFTV